jgi:hypothetical protein
VPCNPETGIPGLWPLLRGFVPPAFVVFLMLRITPKAAAGTTRGDLGVETAKAIDAGHGVRPVAQLYESQGLSIPGPGRRGGDLGRAGISQ